MMFTAAIVAMWDIEHAGGGDWVMPKRRKTPGVFGAEDKVRVWVKPRQT
jgi:hypothetical protein